MKLQKSLIPLLAASILLSCGKTDDSTRTPSSAEITSEDKSVETEIKDNSKDKKPLSELATELKVAADELKQFGHFDEPNYGYGTPRVKMLDNMTFTLTPGQKLDGPLFYNTTAGRNAYGTQYLTTLFKEANKIATQYKRQGDYKAYYTFMMLAMTVPMHEALWMHFIKTDDQEGLCNPYAQAGKTLVNPKESDYNLMTMSEIRAKEEKVSKTISNFRSSMKSGAVPFLTECSDIAYESDLRHIIRGYDGSDVGAMQLSIRWHLDGYFAPEGYKSLAKTFAYGLNFIHEESFAPLYAANTTKKPSSNYLKQVRKKTNKCMRVSWSKKTEINYENMIRGAWAGKYNSGNIYNACRFKKKNNHDKWFANNLAKIYGFLLKDTVGFNDDLSFTPEKKVKNYMNSIICGFHNNVQDITKLQYDLKRKSKSDKMTKQDLEILRNKVNYACSKY